jgi:hypothetical protein
MAGVDELAQVVLKGHLLIESAFDNVIALSSFTLNMFSNVSFVAGLL